MADLGLPTTRAAKRSSWASWRNRLVASPWFQSWAARFPLTRSVVRREGEVLFDLVSGFVQSQVLQALIELGVLHQLKETQKSSNALAGSLNLPMERAEILLNAGVALGLLELRRGQYQTSRLGAALIGVPGLEGMIAHHDVLYRDLTDPVAFFRGETETELANFWPYVFGAMGDADPAIAARYSRLMAESQSVVADETLRQVNLSGIAHLTDVGGGSGVFLSRVAQISDVAQMTLFDLPGVMPSAEERIASEGLESRIDLYPGSFRTDALPASDAISLIRVLYDHGDATVLALLSKIYDSLCDGGRLIVSEPMRGANSPTRAGDVYFATYCLAMRTGRARAPQEIATLLTRSGFDRIRVHKARRPFITTVIEARKPD